eukprot:CAMPEP_0170190088 /NCGR_PEP_ID=MMETSP0040_2-20121228/48587_1 /TAXON_ID=641309 /ORGANISM="Lotharella oceanica, Strain CCMP622" /LENGTH=52 /DNA_ID=CAMNT_0010437875 /DNA_START=508 /DNA_END=666 /DNA_ORIENTATION=-
MHASAASGLQTSMPLRVRPTLARRSVSPAAAARACVRVPAYGACASSHYGHV